MSMLSPQYERHMRMWESFYRIKKNEMAREQQKLENKRDGEEIQRLKELYQWERRKEKESREKQKRDIMQAHLVGSSRAIYL